MVIENIEKQIPKNLRSFVGEFVTLLELPDGHASNLSQVKIGSKYRVKDISGSSFMIVLPNGSTEFIHYGRFAECR